MPNEDLLTPEQRREIYDSIVGRAELPLKFSYMGEEGATAWEGVFNKYSKDQYSLRETRLLKRMINHILTDEKIEELYFIDLGSGEGTPALRLVEFLNEKGIAVDYVPVDISAELLERAAKKLRAVARDVKPVQLDFDSFSLQRLLLETSDRPKLIGLLGATLGNHSNEVRILTNIREAMGIRDHFFVTVTLFDPLTFYSHAPKFVEVPELVRLFTAGVRTFFGLSEDDFILRYHADQNRMEIVIYIEMKREVEVDFWKYKIPFKKNARIVVGRIRRYTPAYLLSLMDEVSLVPYALSYDREGNYIFSVDGMLKRYF